MPVHGKATPTADDDKMKTWSSTSNPADLAMSTVDDYVIVDLPSPVVNDDDSSNRVPPSEFFPVSHVVLNPDDLTMCVVNIGLCVMLYSFQSAQMSPTVRVSTPVHWDTN